MGGIGSTKACFWLWKKCAHELNIELFCAAFARCGRLAARVRSGSQDRVARLASPIRRPASDMPISQIKWERRSQGTCGTSRCEMRCTQSFQAKLLPNKGMLKSAEPMKPRITVITIGVGDLEASLRFYRDGLGIHLPVLL